MFKNRPWWYIWYSRGHSVFGVVRLFPLMKHRNTFDRDRDILTTTYSICSLSKCKNNRLNTMQQKGAGWNRTCSCRCEDTALRRLFYQLAPFIFIRGVMIRFNEDMMCVMIHGWWCDTRSVWTHLERYGMIRFSDWKTEFLVTLLQFLCSGRWGKTVEKLDTMNSTNIQFKASIQSVWNADWKSLVLLLLPAVIHRYLKRRCWRNTQWMNWRNIYNYFLPLYLHKIHPHNNVWPAKNKALAPCIDAIEFCFEKWF